MILAKKIYFVLVPLLLVAFQLAANGGPALVSFSNGVRNGAGFQCASGRGPIIYRVADIGKPGVPRLSRMQEVMIASIRKYVLSPALSFVRGGDAPSTPDLIVFNPISDLCRNIAGGFAVLNGSCNQEYQPGENPNAIVPTSGMCVMPPRAWMKEPGWQRFAPPFWTNFSGQQGR